MFVHLWGQADLIAARLEQRRGHFMPPSALLASQFDTLEPPVAAIAVEVDRPVAETVERIIAQLDIGSPWSDGDRP